MILIRSLATDVGKQVEKRHQSLADGTISCRGKFECKRARSNCVKEFVASYLTAMFILTISVFSIQLINTKPAQACVASEYVKLAPPSFDLGGPLA